MRDEIHRLRLTGEEKNMIERSRRTMRGVIISLALVLFGHAHAEDSITANYDGDRAGVIEEIIVVGNKKGQRLNPDRRLINGPTVEKPSRFRWQVLPAYDPEEAGRNFGHLRQNERIGRVGIVTLFRISFGR